MCNYSSIKEMTKYFLTTEGFENIVAVITSDYTHWHAIIAKGLPETEILKINGIRYEAYLKLEKEEMKKKAELERIQRQGCSGLCIIAGSIVSVIIEDTPRTKKVQDLQKGDIVVSQGIFSEVECIVSSNYKGPIYGNEDCWVTAGHPVLGQDGLWKKPEDFFISNRKEYEGLVFSVILQNRASSLLVGEFQVATLAHGLHDPIIEHDYLGSEKIVDDLKALFSIENYNQGKLMVDIVRNTESNFISSVSLPK